MTANDIYTVAGTTRTCGTTGNGTAATSARLSNVTDVAFDSSGNLYIDDSGNSRILEVPHSTGSQWGVSMTAAETFVIAGYQSATHGYSGDGGPGTSSSVNHPVGIAFDSSGDLFISDSGNNVVRELASGTTDQFSTTASDIYTLAGTGASGTAANGTPSSKANLSSPYGVATDSSGNVYFADQANNRVEEIAGTNHTQWGITMTAGDVYIIAGSASGTAGNTTTPVATSSSLLDDPYSVGLDLSGDLYIADYVNSKVREVAATTHSQWGVSMTANDIFTVAGDGSWGTLPTGSLGGFGLRSDGPSARRSR